MEPGNVDQLVERIEELLEDPELAEEMGRKGRDHMVENYDEEKAMSETLRKLRKVAQGS